MEDSTRRVRATGVVKRCVLEKDMLVVFVKDRVINGSVTKGISTAQGPGVPGKDGGVRGRSADTAAASGTIRVSSK